MISLYQLENGRLSLVENYSWTLKEVLEETRRLWNESDGKTVFLFLEGKRLLATMLKCQEDTEIAITVDAQTGAIERHRCHYLVDSEGFYEGTQVTPLI